MRLDRVLVSEERCRSEDVEGAARCEDRRGVRSSSARDARRPPNTDLTNDLPTRPLPIRPPVASRSAHPFVVQLVVGAHALDLPGTVLQGASRQLPPRLPTEPRCRPQPTPSSQSPALLTRPHSKADLLLICASSSPALLTLVLDLSPLAWHDASAASSVASPDGQPESLTLKAMLAQVLIFMNAHLAATAGNRLAVWGVKGRKRYVRVDLGLRDSPPGAD